MFPYPIAALAASDVDDSKPKLPTKGRMKPGKYDSRAGQSYQVGSDGVARRTDRPSRAERRAKAMTARQQTKAAKAARRAAKAKLAALPKQPAEVLGAPADEFGADEAAA